MMIAATIAVSGCGNTQVKSDLTLIIGTYTSTGSKGIYTYRFNQESLKVTPLAECEVSNPSFMTLSSDNSLLYTVSEGDEKNSAMVAYKFDIDSGELEFIDKTAVDAAPCHIWLDEERSFVASANYVGGSLAIRAIDKDGAFVPSSAANIDISGLTDRQAHIHCIQIAPWGNSLFATDLGNDAIYNFSLEGAKLLAQDTTFLPKGSGPRHLTFNNAGDRAYLINELSGYVAVYRVENSKLVEMQSILADSSNAGGSADIHLSPDEKFLYASTRLEGDGITIFRVKEDGSLEKIGYQATGKHPRNFAITPDGSLLLVACRDSDCVQIFQRDVSTGLLQNSEVIISLNTPVFVKFL